MACCVTELAKARKRIKELEAEKPPLPPEIMRIKIQGWQLTNELDALGLTTLYRRLDSQYVHTDSAGWIEVISYIYTYMPMPRYFVKPDGTWNLDCENFAIWFMDMVALSFGLNLCGLAFGLAPSEHGFNILCDEVGLKLYEPQPARDINHPFLQDENGYHAREVLI